VTAVPAWVLRMETLPMADPRLSSLCRSTPAGSSSRGACLWSLAHPGTTPPWLQAPGSVVGFLVTLALVLAFIGVLVGMSWGSEK